MAGSVWGECSSYFWKWWKYHDNTSYSNNITYVCWAATQWQVFTPIIHTHFFFPTFIFIVRSRGKREFHLQADRLRLWKVWAIAWGHLARRRVQPVDPRFAISLSLQAWFQAPPSMVITTVIRKDQLCLLHVPSLLCGTPMSKGPWSRALGQRCPGRGSHTWKSVMKSLDFDWMSSLPALESRPNWVLSSSHTEAT